MDGDGERLDKWLWAARFCKSRSIASDLCLAGRVRMSGRVIDKAHATVRIGDVLTFPFGNTIKVVRVLGLAEKRGSAPVARMLYEEL